MNTGSNTEAILVPTFGKQAMLGTNPIAFAIPADPIDFCFDTATVVVPRGKLEVYAKRGNGLPKGWAVDEERLNFSEPDRIYTHGEKAQLAKARVLQEGVSLNEKIYDEMKMIAEYTGAQSWLPAFAD